MAILTDVIHGFSQFLQANSGIVTITYFQILINSQFMIIFPISMSAVTSNPCSWNSIIKL